MWNPNNVRKWKQWCFMECLKDAGVETLKQLENFCKAYYSIPPYDFYTIWTEHFSKYS